MPNRSLGKFKIQIALGDVLLKSGPSSKPYGTSFNLLDPLRSGYVVSSSDFSFYRQLDKDTVIGYRIYQLILNIGHQW